MPDEVAPDNIFPIWRQRLFKTPRGPKPLLANAMIAFKYAPEWQGKLGFDEFNLRLTWIAASPFHDGTKGKAWSETDDVRAADWLQQEGIEVSASIAASAADAIARETPFHPIRDYLNGLAWDSVQRLDFWVQDYLGVADSEYTRAVGAAWMISAVARIFQPGVKADACPIFEGPQDLGKSTVLRRLGEPWFTDDIADLGTKDAAMQLSGAWLVELAELDSMTRSEVNKIKAFISRQTDRFRPPYGRRVIEAPRQSVFAGTVNDDQYLRDHTGGRRFWPLRCTKALPEELARLRDQLWAEAVRRYQTGEKWWLNDRISPLAQQEQADRLEQDSWHELIAEFIIGYSSISVDQVLDHCIQKPRKDRTQADANRVARCLKTMKWFRRRDPDGARRWRYWPLQPKPKDLSQSQLVPDEFGESGT